MTGTPDLFNALGFRWDRTLFSRWAPPRHSLDRVLFHYRRMLPEYIWDAAVLEGNPYTFPEVKTLLDGITVGGHKLSDQEQILNLRDGALLLIFTQLHAKVARNEALEWGVFRGEGEETHYTPEVSLGEHGRYRPPPTLPGAPELNRIFREGVSALSCVEDPMEKGLAFFLFGALQPFFFDGNKRTSRFMMNGVLLSSGIDAISVPAAQAQVFNEKMVRFYLSKDGTEMLEFLLECHPEFPNDIQPVSPEPD